MYLDINLVAVVFAIDSSKLLFAFLAVYSYDVYFSIVVLKVGLKLISIIRYRINYQRYFKIIIGSYIAYQLLLLGSLLFYTILTGI